jgi:hypothetical protein
MEPTPTGLRLRSSLLPKIAPAVTRVALLFNPETAPFAQHYMSFIETSAPAFGVTANAASVRSVNEIEAAVEAQARVPGGGLVVLPDAFTFSNRAPLIALAARYRFPAIYAVRGHAVDGGLLSYGPDTADLYKGFPIRAEFFGLDRARAEATLERGQGQARQYQQTGRSLPAQPIHRGRAEVRLLGLQCAAETHRKSRV